MTDIVHAYVFCSCGLALAAANMFNVVIQDWLNVTPGLGLGAFAKLRKASVSFLVSVCVRPSVRTEQLRSHRMDFHGI